MHVIGLVAAQTLLDRGEHFGLVFRMDDLLKRRERSVQILGLDAMNARQIARPRHRVRLDIPGPEADSAGLKRANIEVNRKLLADMAVRDAHAFAQLAEVAKSAVA